MFILNIMDEYKVITDSYVFDTLEAAIEEVKRHTLDAHSIDDLQLLKEIELEFTVDIKVKAE